MSGLAARGERHGARFVCAIDAQISPDQAGGTETALVSLLQALGRLDAEERFLLLGLAGYGRRLRPFMGPSQRLLQWPALHSWYRRDDSDEHPAEDGRRSAGSTVRSAGRSRSREKAPLGPLTEGLRRRLGPAGWLVPPAVRFYEALRGSRAPARPLPAGERDALLRRHGVRVIHFPSPHRFATRLPFVYEPWGLPHEHFPEHFEAGEREWMDSLLRQGCASAALVITATRWAKRDVVSRYGIDGKRVAVIPRVPPAWPASKAPRSEAQPDLPEPFALFPAMTFPTKNHLGLLHALARLRDVHGVTLRVACTGRPHEPQLTRIRAEVAALGLAGQVHWLGPVSRPALERLFSRARFLLFPSLFEGLGLPLLEAFQHRLPVLASDAACIPEVVGDAALLFDPNSEESMAAALLRGVREPALLEQLAERGAGRIARHSADLMARRFVACYRRAAAAPLSHEQEALLAEMTED